MLDTIKMPILETVIPLIPTHSLETIYDQCAFINTVLRQLDIHVLDIEVIDVDRL
jgi:hypothetical protein